MPLKYAKKSSDIQVSRHHSRIRMRLRGAVQGVGFRPFVFRIAVSLGLTGFVQNNSEGVLLEAEGPEARLRTFQKKLLSEKPPHVYYYGFETSFQDALGGAEFEIRESARLDKTRAYLLPDIAVCDECLSEIRDPENRRYRYPFTNCTHCGPRFSIITAAPYDRQNTTMNKFNMCEQCRSEYIDPSNRRFHAQPNACPECGPSLEFRDSSGNIIAGAGEALVQAASKLKRGALIAVKGIGGYHLLCLAGSVEAAEKLRVLKQRRTKPFAVMFPDLKSVRAVCRVSAIEEMLLTSPQAPIVFLSARKECGRFLETAAPGNPYLGVLLPYSPLHALLLDDLREPVITTSANFRDEMIATSEQEVVSRFKGHVDFFLTHDRVIARHADDSIVRVMAGRELVLRRGRGYPWQVAELDEFAPELIAVGGHLKNAVAAVHGREIYLSQHIGDLENEETLTGFKKTLADMTDLYDLKKPVYICDGHPDYLSTQFANETGAETREIQHHYAHALSCMVENRITEPALGIIWDGTGLGSDGTLWGGEFLKIDSESFGRAASLRSFCLPGGEAAIREPRRAALGVLFEMYGERVFDEPHYLAILCKWFSVPEIGVLRAMLRTRTRSPRTSSAGRLFDAVSCLLGLSTVNEFEGDAASKLEFKAARCANPEVYPFNFARDYTGLSVFDWQPMIECIISAFAAHKNAEEIAGSFHATLVNMMVTAARRIEIRNIVLSGGCFQNRYLTELAVVKLKEAGFKPYWHQRVPPNDGGLALGQIMGALREEKLCV